MNENSKIPEILLTMGKEGVNITDIVSELIHLESLSKILKNLNGRDFYNNIAEIVQNSYIYQKEEQKTEHKLTRDEIIKCIHDSAYDQITAEGNGAFEVLMTDSIQNLIKRHKNTVPNTVIMGAKGSGKTFLYREILRNQYWEKFIISMDKNAIKKENLNENLHILTVPLLASGNAGGFHEIIENAIQNYNKCGLRGKISNSIYVNSRDILLEYMREIHDALEWKVCWKKVILNAVNAYQSLEELEEELDSKNIKIVFLVDGLEEIFQHTVSSENERNAITALCRDLIDEMKAAYKNFGLMVFLRKDMVRDSLTINYEQFYSLYRSVELQWSSTEALRLVVWLTSQAVPDFYQEEVELEMAPKEVIDRTLHKLWGVKLGQPTSNEANSSRWILAALSDFNGQLQARDIIRFLEKATVNAGGI